MYGIIRLDDKIQNYVLMNYAEYNGENNKETELCK